MKRIALLVCVTLNTAAHAQTQVTIYNDNFATVKERRELDLKKGENESRVTDITAHLEPDSVVLRDVRDPGSLRILEQNYEGDPLNEGLMLLKSEGKTLSFVTTLQGGETKVVQGKLIRSGYVPHREAYRQYGYEYAARQSAYSSSQGGGQAIVETEAGVQFGLPGRPIFQDLGDDLFLKPTLLWRLDSQKTGKREVEFSYLTGGMRWDASYNAMAPEGGDEFDIVGWVTLENMSGKDFVGAQVKLMAGDVNRVREDQDVYARNRVALVGSPRPMEEAVTERAFDEYHLYDIVRTVDLLDREIKQVEFLHRERVPAKRIYVYDGCQRTSQYRNWDIERIRNTREYGTLCNPKVWVMLEFRNDEKSGLGIPLPRGTVKLYRRDKDGRNEFIGEDSLDHTPKDETVRLFTGNSFDLVGERRQTDFELNTNEKFADEFFEIRLRNHKKDPVDVRVVEHLYRWFRWDISDKSHDFSKVDSQTIEFPVTVPGDGETTITYSVHYQW